MTPALSFIFVNYRSATLLERSLTTLRAIVDAQTTAEYIIVNNDPAERVALEALGYRLPGLRLLHQSENAGFGQASNVGGQAATGEVLFFINPDTELQQGNFLGLLAAFRFRPKAIYGMSLIQASGEREAWSAGAFPTLFRLLGINLLPGLFPRPWQAETIRRTDWVSGAALAIRRDFFQSLGGFDETFFLYFEDVDLARRATAFGAWVGVYPFIAFRHAGGQSHESWQTKKQAYYASQRRYFEKWRPRHEACLLALGHVI